MQFDGIINNFFQGYNNYEIEQITSGNINKSYLITLNFNGKLHKYVLQKINKKVFKNPSAVMDNITKILNHCKNDKLYYVKTLNGNNYYVDADGEVWRVYNYVNNSISFSSTNDFTLIEETGKAFGNFFYKLKTFNHLELNNTIENFHNTKLRFDNLEKSVKENNKILDEIEREYNLILNLKNISCALQTMQENNEIPIRATHNDTKCSNVLFDVNTKKYITVIDLDTVMPGLIAHDFGDGARSICASLPEDSANFDEVRFDLEKFYYYSSGFISQVKDILTEREKQTLYVGIITITTELCVRFLSDYAQNNVYFKTDYPTQNKVRAMNQLVLAYDVLDKEDKIKDITYSLF